MFTKEQNEVLTRTGPGTPMGELFRRFWLPVLLAEELPAPDCPPVRVRLLGEDLVAFKDSDGRIGLLDARCPHRLADLFFGRNEECGLRCVYHGWKFDVAGTCVDMPNEPAESNFKHKVRTTAYPCREWGGLIWTYMGPRDLMADFPQIEWTLVPESHRVRGKWFVDYNYLQAMEGELDNSHISFLHRTLNPTATPTTLRASAQRQFLAKDTAPRGFFKETDYGLLVMWRRTMDEEHYYWRVNRWLMPFCTLIAASPGDGDLSIARVPRDDETSWGFIVYWNPDRPLTAEEVFEIRSGRGFLPTVGPRTFRPIRNRDNGYLIDRALQRSYNFTGITGLTEQDMAVQRGMGPITDRTKENLGTSDAVIVALRRRLLKAAAELQQGVEPVAARNGAAYRIRAVDGVLKRDVRPDDVSDRLMATWAYAPAG